MLIVKNYQSPLDFYICIVYFLIEIKNPIPPSPSKEENLQLPDEKQKHFKNTVDSDIRFWTVLPF